MNYTLNPGSHFNHDCALKSIQSEKKRKDLLLSPGLNPRGFLLIERSFMIEYYEMKNVIAATLILLLVLVACSPAIAVPSKEGAGEKLKQMGIVKGYEKYGLREEKPITEAEFLALVARLMRATENYEVEDYIVVKNPFDEAVNTAYKLLVRFKRFAVRNFYRTLSLYPRYEPAKGITRKSWFFEDAIYLRMKGFVFPEDFDPYRTLEPERLFEYLFSIARIGRDEYIRAPETLSRQELLKLILIEQGLLEESFLGQVSVKRKEAFSLILYLYEDLKSNQ